MTDLFNFPEVDDSGQRYRVDPYGQRVYEHVMKSPTWAEQPEPEIENRPALGAYISPEKRPKPRMTSPNNTDVGNAARFVDQHGSAVRYVGAWSSWLVWDGQRWRRDSLNEVLERAKSVARGLWSEANRTDDADERKALGRWAMQTESAGRIEAMIRLARSDPAVAVDVEHLDADPLLLNVGNGTLDLRTGNLHAHRPENLITKLVPVEYDPEARCPRWMTFLQRILPDPDVRVFVQEALGYSLTGITSEQVLFFAFGSGANGKSTLFETVRSVLGDYARQAEPDLLLSREQAHPTGVADLQGARFVVASELDDGRRLAEAQVKQLTGGDTIKARFMRADFFEFSPTHKLWLHANHRPIVRGTDHAIWRRLRLIPFTVTIPPEDQDRHLTERLADELPGILAWAVHGCLRWAQQGLSQPEAVRMATEAYRAEMDVLGGFLGERCTVGETESVAANDLYGAYSSWCESNGEKAVSQHRFGRALTEKGFERRQVGADRRRHWQGVALL